MHKKHDNGLNKMRAGIALGIICSVYMVLLVAMAAFFGGWGQTMINIIGSLYRGFDVSARGAVIGAMWAFADGFIGGYLFALVYNFLSRFKL